ncbi:MAG: C25 family cysteine peptidase [Candidatus Thermoplasmatota archaeon]|nr:C25 family cysteine peptidase [Candidatus Thermoplasmatota archaeon]
MIMLNKKYRVPVVLAILAVLLLAMYSPSFLSESSPDFKLYTGGVRASGSEPLLVELSSAPEAGACFAPIAADGREFYRELYFKSTGQNLLKHIAPSGEKTVSLASYGEDASAASIGVAEEFWTRMEMAVVVGSYADALRAAPLAALVNAPIVYNGPGIASFIERNGIKSILSVGGGSHPGIGTKHLNSQQETWDFYLVILQEMGLETNYIVVAGEGDMLEGAMIPYLSLTSAQLAVHMRALVCAGDYTVPLNYTWALGYGIGAAGQGERGGDSPAFNETAKMEYQRTINEKAILVDNHIDLAAETLNERGMSPEYLALVGGIDTVPMMYITNPIWYHDANSGENGEEFVATDSYYGDLDIILDPEMNHPGGYICQGSVGAYEGTNYESDEQGLYTQELAVGRVVAPNVLDASALLVRSLSWDLQPSKHSILSSRACGTASGGASEEQRLMLAQYGITSTRPGIKGFWSVYDIIASHALGDPARITEADLVVYNGHGFPDGWFYSWVHANDYDNSPDSLRSEDVLGLELRPSVFFSASCLCSALDWPTIWKGASDEKRYEELGNEMYISLAFIRAGAIAHIGNTEESWGSFLGGQMDGYGAFDMATLYFEEIMAGQSIGKAHSTAKENFLPNQSESAVPIWQACFLINVLYGEPSVTYIV